MNTIKLVFYLFPLSANSLSPLRSPQTRQTRLPLRKEAIVSKKYYYSKFSFFIPTKLDLPSALVRRPLQEDQGGPQYQLLQVLPVIVPESFVFD